MRLAALGLLLLAVYAATLSIPATAGERYAGDEPHHLLAARSWVEDGDLDLSNQYAERQWREFSDRAVPTSGTLVLGRLREPQGVGMPLAISPAYALGGARAVELAIAALTALAFVLAAALARRIVPEPWASGACWWPASRRPRWRRPPPSRRSRSRRPCWPGGAVHGPGARARAAADAYGAGLMLGLLPWLDPALAVAGLPIAVCLVRWTLAQRRRLVALTTAELLLGSLVFYARLNETLFGGPLPSAARAGPAEDAASIAERAPNLLGLWLDPAAGLLRWAPVLALAFAGAWLLLRSRREHVAAAIPERREAERVAELLVATIAAQWLVAAFTVDGPEGEWFPGLPLFAAVPAMAAMAAWGMRHARVAGAVLAVVTLALSAWVLGDAWTGPAEGWIGVSR